MLDHGGLKKIMNYCWHSRASTIDSYYSTERNFITEQISTTPQSNVSTKFYFLQISLKIEEVALSKLILKEDYARKVLPFVKPDYFDVFTNRVLFETLSEYITKFDTTPEPNALKIEIEKRKDITDDIYQDIEKFLDNLDRDHYNDEWLVDTTDKWCKERAIYLA